MLTLCWLYSQYFPWNNSQNLHNLVKQEPKLPTFYIWTEWGEVTYPRATSTCWLNGETKVQRQAAGLQMEHCYARYYAQLWHGWCCCCLSHWYFFRWLYMGTNSYFEIVLLSHFWLNLMNFLISKSNGYQIQQLNMILKNELPVC